MAITYSEDQLSVINSRDKNLLVSAAAGSGKTAVLVERIIQRIMDKENPIDIDRILVVTFTSASAGEMKERIMEALEKKLEEEPENQRLQKQATLVHNAHIMTIDSFCLDLVKNNFHKIGVDPSFRVAANGETDLLKKDAMDNIMEAAYEKQDPEFYNLIDCYVTKDKDTSVEDSILRLFSFAMSYPKPEEWLMRQKNEYLYKNTEELMSSPLIKRLCEQLLTKVENMMPNLEKLGNLCVMPGGPTLYTEAVNEYKNTVSSFAKMLSQSSFLDFSKALSEYKPSQLSRKKMNCDPDILETAKNLRNLYKSQIDKLKKSISFSSPEYELESLNLAGRVVSVITDLTIEFMHEFARLKKDRGIIDFSDMEHFALDIMLESFEDIDQYTVTDVAREYQKLFDEVMIDEYQDSNLVQEILLAAVSHQNTDMTPNRFMVGDVKQSIYRFRLARPQIFRSKTKSFKDNPDSSQVISLKQNFRSRVEVIDSVNEVFYSIMNPELGGIPYTEDEALYAKAEYEESPSDNKTELRVIKNDGKRKRYVREEESMKLGYLIKGMIGTRMVQDKETKKLRPASYRDIVVLTAKPSNWRDNICEVFEKLAIPYHMDNVGTFYGSHEIQDVLNVLRILDNPLNDIFLFGAMTSFFGGFSDEKCARIKGEGAENEYYLWEKLLGYMERHPEDEQVKNFVDFVEEYRELSLYTPIGDLITRLVTTTGYILYVSAGSDGRQKEANVEYLIKKASDYAKTSFSGIFHFLRFVELFEKTGQDEGEVGIFDENSDTVRVMSIHKSKGLEFPICIVMGLEDTFNTNDQTAEFVTDIDTGIGAKAIDATARTKRSNIKRDLISAKIADDDLGEQIRLLYVAMTRAKEKLILLGSAKDPLELFDTIESKGNNCFLNLLIKAINKDEASSIRFITEIPEVVLLDETEQVMAKKEARANLEATKPSPELVDSIKQAVTYEYPHKNLEKLCIKTTVSQLKMAAMEEVQGETEALFKEREKEEYIPRFAGGQEKVGGTDRGTAYHNVLQLIDFAKEPSNTEWENQISAVISLGKITAEEAGLVNKKRLFSFASSDMAKRMHIAATRGELFKEQPFVMGVPANRLGEDYPADETVLVQGVIDVFFYENDKVVVLDYKTDKVENAVELAERYQKQLDIYAEALEKLTGRSVSEKALYSFALNEEIVLK
ncbi:MAG: helicase-exonuclease AddAB subunit AddA [Lachnospiraceae bacterium]|nr:helicase-exonuclease AddAB subunit AddA [Lachnospiraceae bacterium]